MEHPPPPPPPPNPPPYETVASFSDQLRAHRQSLNQSPNNISAAAAATSSNSSSNCSSSPAPPFPSVSPLKISGRGEKKEEEEKRRSPIHIPRAELINQLHQELEEGGVEREDQRGEEGIEGEGRGGEGRVGEGREVFASRTSQFRRQSAINPSKEEEEEEEEEEEPEIQITYL